MTENIVVGIREFILSTTETAARKDWSKVVGKHRLPPYNYRFDHVSEVVRIAEHIAKGLDVDVEAVTLAAWLHDVAKPGIGGVKNHAEASAELAFSLLSEMELKRDLINLVCDTIRKHAGLTLEDPLEPLEAQVLWEADKIVKLGVTGFLHYVLNSLQIAPGKSLEGFSLEVRRYLPLAERIASSMSTGRGKELAVARLETLKRLAQSLQEELQL